MHIYALQPACNHVCLCMWLCAFKICSKLLTMFACACDNAHFCYAVSSQLCVHEHVTIHIYAMRSACDYSCMCMWLCIYMLCIQLVIMNAWACDYAHLWWADSSWLCMHAHVIMHIYAMQPARNYVCNTSTARSQTMTLQELELCTFMPSSQLVTMHACGCVMHIYVMQSDCNFACMSMWLCMHVHEIMRTNAMQSACN